MDLDAVAYALGLTGLLVGLVLGWYLHRRRIVRHLGALADTRVQVLNSEVLRLGARSDELDALLDVAGRDSTRTRAELAAAKAEGARLEGELRAARSRVAETDAALDATRAEAAAERARRTVADQEAVDRGSALAAELGQVRTAAAESEAEVVVLRSRLDARDATLTALQQHTEQLEALQAPAPPEPDDLGLIDGVGRLVERMLHEAGITTYRQLALLSDKADGSDARLAEFLDRIRREEWADQARDLHKRKYGEELSVG